MKELIKTIGTEVEFSSYEEKRLMDFFMALNDGALYDILLVKKRKGYYKTTENSQIYEYRSPVISGDSYYRFLKYYFFISYFSSSEYVEGAYDNKSGSMHTHLNFEYKMQHIKALKTFYPLFSRVGDGEVYEFRYNARNRAQDCIIDTLDDIYEDSKMCWITFNTSSQCLEVRLNENIPMWYILLKYVQKDDRMGVKYPNRLLKRAYKDIENIEFKTPIQKTAYKVLLDYLDWRLNSGEAHNLQSFSEFILDSELKGRINRHLNKCLKIMEEYKYKDWYD